MELSGCNYDNQKRHDSSKIFQLNSYTYVKDAGLKIHSIISVSM
jgi:hypothetical protein